MLSNKQMTEYMRNLILWTLVHVFSAGSSLGQTSCDADLNGDFVVNLHDLLSILTHFGDSCQILEPSYTTILVSEIHYNPHSSQGNDSNWEFLELFNPNDFAVPLAGWQLDNAIAHSFEESDLIDVHGFLVIARNRDTLADFVPSETPIIQWGNNEGLNNSGETVTLLDPQNDVVATVSYEDNDGWVTAPDGQGPSLELMDINLPNAEVASWAASFSFGGTPGSSNSMWGLSENE